MRCGQRLLGFAAPTAVRKNSRYLVVWIMTLLLVSLQGGHAWVNTVVAKATCSSSGASSLRFHTQAALRFRCGGGSDASRSASTTKLLSGLWRANRRVPFWATASTASCLFQSTAAAADAEITTTLGKESSSSTKAAAASTTTTTTQLLADDKDFIKPDPDLRQYRWVKLANNLQVLLVSTTETTSTDGDEDASGEGVSHVEAAAVHVQAGHFDDTIPGVSRTVLNLCSTCFCCATLTTFVLTISCYYPSCFVLDYIAGSFSRTHALSGD